jgi:histidyl-tRNA synthetase
VTTFNPETINASLQAATRLRQAGINTSLYNDSNTRLGEQIGYASAKGIPFVVIAGPDEVAAGNVTLRKLGKTAKDSEQKVVALDEMVEILREWMG